jgi:hypothetical protein
MRLQAVAPSVAAFFLWSQSQTCQNSIKNCRNSVCACALVMWTEKGASWRRDRPSFSGGLFLRTHNHQGTGKRKAGQIVAASIPGLHDSCLELSQ